MVVGGWVRPEKSIKEEERKNTGKIKHCKNTLEKEEKEEKEEEGKRRAYILSLPFSMETNPV